MALSLQREKGVPLDAQKFTWRDMVQKPISKLDDDAFTRVRVILMNGIEEEAKRFQHSFARMCPNSELRQELARVRRKELHQQVLVNWLLGADHSVLETTIGYEQVAIEVTAAVAQNEQTRISRRCIASGCSKTSITCTATPRSWIGSKGRTRTTSSSATRTSCRDVRP